MAGFALSTALQMGFVTEENVAWQLIDSLPGNSFLCFMELGQLCDLRRFLLDTLMASHAFGRGRNAHELTWILVFMAVFAFQTHRKMRFMTIGNGLLGSLGDRCCLKKSQK